ncbi:MAG: dihydroorotate dehydrogenase 2 [Nitrososphaerota archaeon]|nr:dihydroorotate dehydrogenase 2 [Candidatus Calditenuaceae archaeon]MDW8073370.1 dihydroorotate dehydrogenase 2 [Nitrososphaerota archaeon]
MTSLALPQIAHRLLRLLPPEEAHRAGLALVKFVKPQRLEVPEEVMLETWLGRLAPPIGLAAGLDKTGERVAHLSALGFGYVVAGSITLAPRAGNRRPRIVRREGEALVNAMGLPNPGLDAFVKNLARAAPAAGVPVVASVAGTDPGEILKCYLGLRGAASGVEVNLSSPSLSEAAAIWSEEMFRLLVERLSEAKWCPVALKVPPLARSDLRELVLKAVKIWADFGLESITAVNTLPVPEPRLSTGFGGLSGRPLKKYMLESLRELRRIIGDGCEINAVGGIFTAEDALQAFELGAKTVQIYTALAYRGPSIVRQMITDLAKTLRKLGMRSIEEALP